MKLQQLKYLVAIVDRGLNITAAADALYTSQPGVSKQLRNLEAELSLQLFVRKGRSLSGLTPEGEEIVHRARTILLEVENIRRLSDDLAGVSTGELGIATTHTQARYVLPDLLDTYHQRHPSIVVQMHEGTSGQISQQLRDGEVDFAIASGESDLFREIITLPIYRWERILLVRKDHPLARQRAVSLEELSRFPLISYTNSFNRDASLSATFEQAGLTPQVVFTSHDAEVIKSCVRKDRGVGIVACMAHDRQRDGDLKVIGAAGLFPSVTTWIGFRRDKFLRDYMYDFLQILVPGADRRFVASTLNDELSGVIQAPGALTQPLSRHPNLGDAFALCHCE